LPLGPIIAIITAYGYLLDTEDIQAVEMPTLPDGTDAPGTEIPDGGGAPDVPIEEGNGFPEEIPDITPPGGGGGSDVDDRIRQCINAGGTWNEQFQQCDLPPEQQEETPPEGTPPDQMGCPTLGDKLAIGTKIELGPNCGSDSGRTGRVTGHLFQRPTDRRCNDISNRVAYDGGGSNAWRLSETAPAPGACLFRAGDVQTISCGPEPTLITTGLIGTFFVVDSTDAIGHVVGDFNNIAPPGARIVAVGQFDQAYLDWMKCKLREGTL